MNVAIMQPYIFPYIGYYQLVSAVDTFVIYDDVSFIKQGWINRNNILSNGQSIFFTLPLAEASSNRLIRDIVINERLFEQWRTKTIRTLLQSYSKAPYKSIVVEIFDKVLKDNAGNSISAVARKSIEDVQQYLSISTNIIPTSTIYNNQNLSGQERVLDICRIADATVYINPIGGVNLYNKKDFLDNNIELFFLKTKNIQYKQFNEKFVPWLSMLDVLMFNSIDEVRYMLTQYELI